MARSELRVKPSVGKDLHGLPRADVQRLLERMQALRDNARPEGCEKLTGMAQYRVRQGVYRIVYAIDDGKIVVEVVRVGHRSEVYSPG